jgi:hypothetical protein
MGINTLLGKFNRVTNLQKEMCIHKLKEKKSQISSAMKVKIHKSLSLFKNSKVTRVFEIFKVDLWVFTFHSASDLRFFSLQFVNFTICKLLALSKFTQKELIP